MSGAKPGLVAVTSETVEQHKVEPGRFIVLEGLDRAGKTTQCALLSKALEAAGRTVLQVRFPDRTTPIGKLIDAYLLKEVEIEDHAVHLLFSANRYELKGKIEAALNKGTDVVCDRYVLSGVSYTYARQIKDDSVFGSLPSWIMSADRQLLKPDLTIMLRLDSQYAAERQGWGEERHEQPMFQKRVQSFMQHYWKHYSWSKTLAEINGSQSIESVHRDIKDQVDQLMETKEKKATSVLPCQIQTQNFYNSCTMSALATRSQKYSVILATGPNGELGFENDLPWPTILEDMRHFTHVTTGRTRNAVVMGRKTWTSIPEAYRPFRKRRNIVLSRDPDAREKYGIPESVTIVDDFNSVWKHVGDVDQCFVIGGATLYRQALDSGHCCAIYHTIVEPKKKKELNADVWFRPVFNLAKVHSETCKTVETEGYKLTFRYIDLSDFIEPDEKQYLNLVQRIMDTGVKRGDRTGVGTMSIFGAQMRFSLRNGTMPLLTTKNVFWRGVAMELLWFVSGSTSVPELSKRGVKIWEANGSRTFLDDRGLETREEGDLGPVYGFQWRHFGAKYVDMHTDYTGQGVDQLANVINQIKTNPNSRRIIMSAWNPLDLDQMALPPCHVMAQFYVDGKKLSCMLTIRSNDISLGAPFNIASYALLTHMIAHCCDLEAEELVYSLGDAHIYLNHVEAMKKQLCRAGYDFPKIFIDAETKDIDKIEYRHLKLRRYAHAPAIAMDMAV